MHFIFKDNVASLWRDLSRHQDLRTDAILTSVSAKSPTAFSHPLTPGRQNSIYKQNQRSSKGTMLLVEQPQTAATFVPQYSLTQQPFSCDFLDVEADLANFVSEEDLRISHSALELLSTESALFDMFQEPSNTSQVSSIPATDAPMAPLTLTNSDSKSHMDIQLPSFDETYSPRFRRDCPDGSDFSFKFEELIATSPDMPSSSGSLPTDLGSSSGFTRPRQSVPGYSSDNTSFSSCSSKASYSGDTTPPPAMTPPCAMASPTCSRRSSLASSTASMSSPLRETATPSRRASTPSPASSISGPIVQQKKKSAGSLPCAVCGDNALCQHYGVRTCEGCKGFFKRTVQRKQKYACMTDKKCTIDKEKRNRCQYCRYEKCLAVGMDPEFVRTDDLKGRRGRLPSKPKLQSHGSQLNISTVSPTISAPSPPPTNLIGQLVHAHQISSPEMSNRDFTRFQELKHNTEHVPRTPQEVQEFYELLTSSIVVIRKFVDAIPGFRELLPEDRELLFTTASLGLFALRVAYRMMHSNHTEITLCNSVVLHRSQAQRGFGEWLDRISVLSKSLENFAIDESILACLAALFVLDARAGVKEPAKVERLAEAVTNALREHVSYIPQGQQRMHYFSSLLAKIPTDLRSISVQGLRGIFYLMHEEVVPAPPLLESLFEPDLPY
ncbi:probable nuclear hormone receptor HR38 [Galendromus occidentalis]|uniref:Probable nuclear hormone receptor HR38 n=1 Tax=Galendromus occidentalis TaxID=34638 RepID=A0AAJ7SGS9_9ACAR|nr:probable nuclear hormone receptor HR38 [Galendromus occidentalis]